MASVGHCAHKTAHFHRKQKQLLQHIFIENKNNSCKNTLRERRHFIFSTLTPYKQSTWLYQMVHYIIVLN